MLQLTCRDCFRSMVPKLYNWIWQVHMVFYFLTTIIVVQHVRCNYSLLHVFFLLQVMFFCTHQSLRKCTIYSNTYRINVELMNRLRRTAESDRYNKADMYSAFPKVNYSMLKCPVQYGWGVCTRQYLYSYITKHVLEPSIVPNLPPPPLTFICPHNAYYSVYKTCFALSMGLGSHWWFKLFYLTLKVHG